MPDWENPTADSSSESSACALSVIVVLVVEKESRIDRMSCAASEYARVVWPNSCQSCRTVSIRGLTASSTLFPPVMACPMTSPLPRRDSATADSTEFSFAGSIGLHHRLQILEHRVDLDGHIAGVQHRPRLERLGAGVRGTIRSTYLAPNAVLDLISASTLLGRYWNGPG